jgi:thiol:disulfide interchange protein
MSLTRRAISWALAAFFTGADAAMAEGASEAPVSFQPWSAQRVVEARNAGKSVFIAFRADWCVICKVNEMTVLKTQKVRETLSRPDVAYFIADYTSKNDPAIRTQIDYYQAGAFPMYLAFTPGARKPKLLPQVLGVKDIVTALQMVAH